MTRAGNIDRSAELPLPTATPLPKCTGTYACLNVDPSQVSDGACNGDYACYHTSPYTGTIGAGSCIIDSACGDAGGSIGAGSCNGVSACDYAAGPVGTGSCNGIQACYFAAGAIGNNSCNTTGTACRGQLGNTFPVGDCQRNDTAPAACIVPRAYVPLMQR